MTLRVVPLDTNGHIPTLGRHTASYLVLAPEQAVLLDASAELVPAEPAIDSADSPLARFHPEHRGYACWWPGEHSPRPAHRL